jgi:alpha-mannosidase
VCGRSTEVTCGRNVASADSLAMTPIDPSAPLLAFVVSHTHWDREWYHAAEEFRIRLIDLIDELLDAAQKTPFLLDGQGVILEDYLALRPERAAELTHAFREGWLEAGPWLVLSDELIPGAEGLVRNLLFGRRVLRRLRADPPAVLYCPDSFGHPAALPELARGFDMDLTVVWRGYGGSRWPQGDSARWRSPGGAETLLHHLPPDGYEFGNSLPLAGVAADERWERIRATLAPRATLGIMLILNGADHHARQNGLPQALASLAKASGPVQVRQATLGAAAHELRRRAARIALPLFRGELRDSYGYTWTLQGTLASRASQKRRYASVERLLLRDVEPWLALQALKGHEARVAALNGAWHSLLLCQPHDSICGCSSDAVARAVDARLDEAEAQGVVLREHATRMLLGHDADFARAHEASWTPVMLIRNRAVRPRCGVAELALDVEIARVPVGPGSAARAEHPASALAKHLSGLGALQLLARDRLFTLEESPRHYPRNLLVERRHVLAWIPEAPPAGLLAVPIGRSSRRADHPVVQVSSLRIENDAMAVAVIDGRIVLEQRDRTLVDLLGLEIDGDRGDLYTASIIEDTHREGTLTRARVTMRGPLRGEISTWWHVALVARELRDATGAPRRAGSAVLNLRIRLQLDAGSAFVRVLVDGTNVATDHRLRLRFRTGIQSPRTFADAAFGVIQRPRLLVPLHEQRDESVPATAPLQRYVSVFSPGGGATVFSDGLAEYESRESGDLLVTLLRAVGELSRADLPERPGHAGWPVATPAAQCTGPFSAAFAIALHGPRSPSQLVQLETMAEDVLLPLTGSTWHSAIGAPASQEGIELRGEGLAFSCAKPSEDGTGVVLRCVNVLDRTVAGAWRLQGASAAWLSRLDESRLGELSVRDGEVRFLARPRGVVTILVEAQR